MGVQQGAPGGVLLDRAVLEERDRAPADRVVAEVVAVGVAAMTSRRVCSGDTRRAMSRENVEIVGRGLEAFSQNDFEAWCAIAGTEIKLYPRREEPGVLPVYAGWDGVSCDSCDSCDQALEAVGLSE